MTTRQQVRIVLVVGMMLMSAVAASTRVESQPSPHGQDVPSVFDGVLSNVAGSSEISTAQLRAVLTDSTAIILDARPYEKCGQSYSRRASGSREGGHDACVVRWRRSRGREDHPG
jgi:hypothetical protein